MRVWQGPIPLELYPTVDARNKNFSQIARTDEMGIVNTSVKHLQSCH
jgi:hypothetical protein